MSASIHKLIIMFLVSLLAHAPAYAGSRQYSGESIYSAEQVAKFSKRVEKYAGSKGARAFIIARLGTPQSELPDQVQFTHVGLAIYSRIKTADGNQIYGYAINNLYQNPNALDQSALFMDYPIDFFAGAQELKAGIIIPKPILQKKLIAAIESGVNQSLHNSNYSMVSNPYSQNYQNCTEHILDIIFSSIYDTESMVQIKANENAYFRAQAIELAPIERLFAPLVRKDIKMTDHSDSIETATFTTISQFLRSYGLADGYTVITEHGKQVYRR